MKFGIQFQLQTPRPYDAETWGPDDEARIFAQALEQIEHADRLGFDYVFLTEHHFLEEYCHSAAPEVVLAAAAARTKQIRLGHGIIQMPPAINHPARVAERVASLDIISGGRVEFGTGEGATETEIGGFGVARADKKEAWEEATRECLRMMDTHPYPGYEGVHFSMPERNIVPKPLQRPHPPVWVAASRRETVMLAARMGIGAMGFGFETPEEAEERVLRYYELIRACRKPLGKTINPALMTLGNMLCAPTDEEAVEKGLRGAQYFGYVFGWMHGHLTRGATTSTATSGASRRPRRGRSRRRTRPSRSSPRTRAPGRCTAWAAAGCSWARRPTSGRTSAPTRPPTSTSCSSCRSAATGATRTSWSPSSCSRRRSCPSSRSATTCSSAGASEQLDGVQHPIASSV